MKIKVLEINGYAMLYRGAEVLLLNIFKEIDRSKIQMDFLTPLNCRNEYMRREIESRGGKIYELHAPDKPIFNKIFFFKMVSFLQHNEYDIVHIHTGSVVFMALASKAAKIAGVKRIIVHSHNSADVSSSKNSVVWKEKIFRPIILKNSNFRWACSDKAAKYMFGDENSSYIMNNGIYLDKFAFSELSRKKIRDQLGIAKDEKLIGHVGQFTEAKNHKFLIDVFDKVVQDNSSIKLLLVGDGTLRKSIETLVENKHLQEKVIFYGISTKIEELLCAVDLFVLPSLFEGLPVVGIEAQCSGLKCLVSDNITRQLDLTGDVEFLPITNGQDKWKERILDCLYNCTRDKFAVEKMREKSFDIHEVAEDVCKQYENIMMQLGGKDE